MYTYDGSTVKGYLNGQEALSITDLSSLVQRGNSLRLGVDGAYQQFFKGSLDDLRIYSRALTPAEIQSVMQTPVGSPTTGVPEPPPGIGGSWVQSVSPNPTSGRVSVAYRLDRAGDVRVSVYDVAGRLVAEPLAASRGPGLQQAIWTGRTAGGTRAAPGVYFLRVTLNGAKIGTRRVVVSR